MAKATREYIYGTNPAFEVLRAKRRTVYGAWLNQSSRTKPRMQKLVKGKGCEGIGHGTICKPGSSVAATVTGKVEDGKFNATKIVAKKK